jgi:hypothetical protein
LTGGRKPPLPSIVVARKITFVRFLTLLLRNLLLSLSSLFRCRKISARFCFSFARSGVENPAAWINLAYAVRRAENIEGAEAILLKACASSLRVLSSGSISSRAWAASSNIPSSRYPPDTSTCLCQLAFKGSEPPRRKTESAFERFSRHLPGCQEMAHGRRGR